MRDQPFTTSHELSPPAARPDRRFVLKAAVGGTILSTLGAATAQSPQALLDDYTPAYFNAAEWTFIRSACARLIPSDGDGPGAIEAQVPVFIDKQMAGEFGKASDWCMIGPHDANADPFLGFQSPLTPAQIYRQGIAAVDEWCRNEKGKHFAELDESGQDDVLKELQSKKVTLKPELRDFFSFLLQNTKEGYFADPMYGGNYKMASWKYIGFPGARGAFREWATDKGDVYPLGPVSISGERG
jgi:gluconate 2-dehydrogenase gamma chain